MTERLRRDIFTEIPALERAAEYFFQASRRHGARLCKAWKVSRNAPCMQTWMAAGALLQALHLTCYQVVVAWLVPCQPVAFLYSPTPACCSLLTDRMTHPAMHRITAACRRALRASGCAPPCCCSCRQRSRLRHQALRCGMVQAWVLLRIA